MCAHAIAPLCYCEQVLASGPLLLLITSRISFPANCPLAGLLEYPVPRLGVGGWGFRVVLVPGGFKVLGSRERTFKYRIKAEIWSNTTLVEHAKGVENVSAKY